MSQHQRKEELHVDSKGNVTITKSFNVEPIFEAVKLSSEIEAPVRNDRGMLHLASIDPLTGANWARESGTAMYSKEWQAYCRKKLQSGEFEHFRVKRKARYV